MRDEHRMTVPDMLKAGRLDGVGVVAELKRSAYYDLLTEAYGRLRTGELYVSGIHGQGHIERVMLLGAIIAMQQGFTPRQTELLLIACSYHDIGRVDDSRDDRHGQRSAERLAGMTLPSVGGEELRAIQAAVATHSTKDAMIESFAEEYRVPEESRDLCRLLCKGLKDADNLDRVRLGDLDVRHLRFAQSPLLAPAAEEICHLSAEAFGMAGSLFDEVRSYIDDNYVAERTEEEYRVDNAPQILYRERRDISLRQRRPRPERAAADEALFDACMSAGAVLEKPAAPSASLEDILRQQHESTFSEYLSELLKERKGKNSEVYKRAEVSKQLFSRILNDSDYRPTKSTAIQLAIGLELDMPQTQKLLEKAGYTLTRSSKADLAVQYFIERGLYSVTLINEALHDCGLPLLSTGLVL